MITATAWIPYTIGGTERVCEFQYDNEDPYAVTLIFSQPSSEGAYGETEEAQWTVGRDILRDGLDLDMWYGDGDVRIRRDSNSRVVVRFITPIKGENFTSEVIFPYRALKLFLQRTFRNVPKGKEPEMIDWDEFDLVREGWGA